jgi:hypothetical protein
MDAYPCADTARLICFQRVHANSREQRNLSASPICRLPEELIVEVLSHWQRDPTGEAGYRFRRESLFIRPWLANLPICRRIWSVAVRTPKLWSTIQIGYASYEQSKKWIDLCEHRGQDFELHVLLSARIWAYLDAIQLLTPRTRRLFLGSEYDSLIDPGDYHDFLVSIITWHWPMLDVLEMRSFDVTRVRWKGECPPMLKGPYNLVSNLRLIDCDAWFLDGLPPHLPHLQHLAITANIPSGPAVLNMLYSHASLLSLVLGFSTSATLDRSVSQYISTHPRPGLPQLRSLGLKGHSSVLVRLLNWLPHASEDLSIDITSAFFVHEALADIDRLLDYTLIYKDQSRLGVSSAHKNMDTDLYKIIFKDPGMPFPIDETVGQPIEITLLPIKSCHLGSPLELFRRLRLDFYCPIDLLPRVVKEVSTAELRCDARFEDALRVLEGQSSIQRLVLAAQRFMGTETSIAALATYLKKRSEPLISLIVEVNPYQDHAELATVKVSKLWQHDGLIEEVMVAQLPVYTYTPGIVPWGATLGMDDDEYLYEH